MANTYAPTADPISDKDLVRLLLNDVAAPWVFEDEELAGFLALEGGVVKLAAATAIATNALNEALASKVLTTEDGASQDGAKLADAMRALARELRSQVADEATGKTGDGYVDIVDTVPVCGSPELVWDEWP